MNEKLNVTYIKKKYDDGEIYTEFIYIPSDETRKNDGVMLKVYSWSCGKEHTPMEVEFLFNGYVKWDACSHYNFFGEDFPKDKDSYYHICGSSSYIDFFTAMAFMHKQFVKDEDEINQFKEITDLLLKDLIIEETTITKEKNPELYDTIMNILNKAK